MAGVMQDLQALEVFEIEVLEYLNSQRVLERLYFGGGTMLRLCHNLNRHSTDLDFWIKPDLDSAELYVRLNELLGEQYKLLDAAEKRNTILFQFRTENIKRSLKIEIRKEKKEFEWERKIAFSKFTNKQVQVRGLTLNQMMKNKIEALTSRKIIRDAFDIEFLIKRGVPLPEEKKKLKQILGILSSFKEQDFKVTLGSLLEASDREYYIQYKFRLLEEELRAKISTK